MAKRDTDGQRKGQAVHAPSIELTRDFVPVGVRENSRWSEAGVDEAGADRNGVAAD